MLIPPAIEDIPAPLIIGVTGHRDLLSAHNPKLEEKVGEILAELRNLFGSATPFILLSPLAEGADRLVARVAIQMGAKLIVPFPMPRELYEKDFQTQESLDEFHGLLAGASDSFVMPMCSPYEQIAEVGEARDRQYQEVGKYIARQSQILIALWDGVLSENVGGTAKVVRFQLEGVDTGDSFQPPELFPVYHIVTPRISNPSPNGKPFQLIKKYPNGFADQTAAQTYYEQIFRNLRDFNNSIREGGKSLIRAATESKRELLSTFDEAGLTTVERLQLDRYSMSDALARFFQRRMLRMHTALHWLVFMIFVGWILFAHLPGSPPWLLGVSLAVLGLSVLLYRRQRAGRLDIKSQDYRAVAEGSRVRFFWHLAVITESVADNYLGQQRTELDWIRNGLRGWSIGIPSQPESRLPTSARVDDLKKLWVADQIKYFHRAAKRNQHSLERVERSVHRCIWLIVIVALAVLITIAVIPFFPHSRIAQDTEWTRWPVIVIDCLLGAAALIHHAGNQRAYAQHTKQFRRMEAVFQRAHALIEQKLKASDIEGAQECLVKLGREALSENGSWVLLHRERPMELPHP